MYLPHEEEDTYVSSSSYYIESTFENLCRIPVRLFEGGKILERQYPSTFTIQKPLYRILLRICAAYPYDFLRIEKTSQERK